MRALELMVWSMALGGIAAVGVARLAEFVARPSLSQLRGVTYHAIVFVFVMVLSGVLRYVLQPDAQRLHALQVLAGPLCVGLSTFWIRGWLSANQRDRVMSVALRLSAVILPVGGLAALLLLPHAQQLPLAAGLSLLGGALMLWLTVRAWLMGDRLAPGMAAGCLLTIPAIGGLYAIAMNVAGFGLAMHFAIASCAALSSGFTGYALWRRDRHEWKARQLDNSVLPFDPVTKMPSGPELVRKLIQAQKRRRRTRRAGAVLAILVFDVDRVAAQVGTAGVNEMYIAIARRIQRQVGVVNPVGRYWERCFVTLVESIHSPGRLRTLGLKVSTSLQQPIEVAGRDGERVSIRADIGVGVVHLSASQGEVEDILHEAQGLAEAARAMRSRAAILDPATGEITPVEKANLGPRRHAHAALVPHAV